MRDLYSDKSHLLDRQTPSGQRSEQLGFRFGQVEPSRTIRAFEDHHLTIVDRRDSPGWVVRIVNASPAPSGMIGAASAAGPRSLRKSRRSIRAVLLPATGNRRADRQSYHQLH
jgi:hypothetical protein